MTWSIVLPGLTLGMISSLHCVGMCGPLMLALPVRHLGKMQQTLAIVLYNTGRLFTYSLLGLLVGLFGRRIYMAGFQRWLSVSLGIAILVFAFFYFVKKRALQPAWIMKFHLWVQERMGFWIHSKNRFAYFMLGVANGLLPCGMVYIAIAASLMTTVVSNSVLFMVLFGIGTLPLMMAFGIFGNRISVNARFNIRKAMPYLLLMVGLLLVLRGMNLGIPFISPVVTDIRQGIPCHN